MKTDQNTKLIERFIEAHGQMTILLQNPLILHIPFFSPDYKRSVQYWEAWLRFGELGIINDSESRQIEAVLKLCREKDKLANSPSNLSREGI